MAWPPGSRGLAAVLIGLAAVELYLALPRPDAQPPAGIAPQVMSATLEDFGYPPNSDVSAWRAEALASPLFAPSRRPAAAAPPPAPVVAPIEKLSGIIVTPTAKIALFSPATGGPIIVTEKSRFGAFAVVSIAVDSVTVKGPGGVMVMHLDTGDDNSDQGQPAGPAPVETILPGGIAVNFIKLQLSSIKPEWPSGTQPF